jgi:hypothetical protein
MKQFKFRSNVAPILFGHWLIEAGIEVLKLETETSPDGEKWYNITASGDPEKLKEVVARHEVVRNQTEA